MVRDLGETGITEKAGECRNFFDAATRTLTRLECHATTLRTGERHLVTDCLIHLFFRFEIIVEGAGGERRRAESA